MAYIIDVFDETGIPLDWFKRAGTVAVKVICIGGGGGGGGGGRAVIPNGMFGGGGGGGGAVTTGMFRAADLPDHVLVTVGAGGTGGNGVAAGTGTSNGGSSTSGGLTTFGSYLQAGGGGGASGGSGAQPGAGGGGAWTSGAVTTSGQPQAGVSDADGVAGAAGIPRGSTSTQGSEWAGAPGAQGVSSNSSPTYIGDGGSSVYGGPGGGSGAGPSGSLAILTAPGAGGNNGTRARGGGGTAGSNGGSPTAGGDGAALGGLYCGQGGGGGGAGVEVSGMAGGNGGTGAGGGGGGTGVGSVNGANGGGAGGNGGDGRVIVISYGGTEFAHIGAVAETEQTTGFAISSNPDLTVTLPDYVAGDIVFLHCNSWNSGITGYGITTPSGWTLLDTPPTGTVREPWVFYKVMDGTEGTTVTLQGSGYTAGANTSKACTASSWRASQDTLSLDGAAVVTTASISEPGTATAGPITTSSTYEQILAFVSANDTGSDVDRITSVDTAGAVERYDDNETTVGLTGMATADQSAAGTYSINMTLENPNQSVTITYRIVTVALMTTPPAVGSFQAILI